MIYDAVVAGAGLAGCAAALRLAQGGWDVLVLEKSAFPRHKVCGEFLSPGIQPLLEKLGIWKEIRSISATMNSAAAYFPAALEFTWQLPESYGLSRLALDRIFLESAAKAGAVILNGADVLEVSEHGTICRAVTSRETFAARNAIIAAGKHSRFDGPERREKFRNARIGFKTHFEIQNPAQRLELYFFDGGYAGIAPVENGLSNLCGIVGARTLKAYGGNIDRLLEAASLQNPKLGARLCGAKKTMPWLACGAVRGFQNESSSRIHYAGDAACFTEPVLGQGMTLAVAHGIALAECLLEGRAAAPLAKKIYSGKNRHADTLMPLAGILTRVPLLGKNPLVGNLVKRRLPEILAAPAWNY